MGKPEKHVQGNKSQKNAARTCHLQYVIIILVFLPSVSISAKWRLAFIQDRNQARDGANEQLLVAGAVPKLPPKIIFSSFFSKKELLFLYERCLTSRRGLEDWPKGPALVLCTPEHSSVLVFALLSVILHIILGLVHQKSQIYLKFEELS